MQGITSNIKIKKDYCQIEFRQNSKDKIFLDENDYNFFLSIFKKCLLSNDSVEALVYCLEPDHFYLLLEQKTNDGVGNLMSGILSEYNKYYFEKYKVKDVLLKKDYEMVEILSNDILDISRKIHLAPEDWKECSHSSIRAYFYDDVPKWLNKDHIADKYGSAVQYLDFLESCAK